MIKKKIKKIISISLAFCLCLSISKTTFASTVTEQLNNTSSIETYLANASKQFDSMSNEELNEYIDTVKEYYTSGNIEIMKSNSSPLEAAWLAASTLMKNKGYKCTGELIECSVNNQDYEEYAINANGLFSKKIVKSSAFKKYLSKFKSTGKDPNGIEFKKSDNQDLFYSLHNVDANTEELSYAGYDITITDTFDFDVETNYKDLVTAIANNGAWLSQQTGCLNNIEVTINFMQ